MKYLTSTRTLEAAHAGALAVSRMAHHHVEAAIAAGDAPRAARAARQLATATRWVRRYADALAERESLAWSGGYAPGSTGRGPDAEAEYHGATE